MQKSAIKWTSGINSTWFKIEPTVYCELRTISKIRIRNLDSSQTYSVNHDQVNYVLKFTFEDFPSRKDHQLKKVNQFTIGKLLWTRKNDL